MHLLVTGSSLQITIQGDLDFEASRELLQACKVHSKSNQRAGISITLENLAELKTCALGALLAISDIIPGDCQIKLIDCGTSVGRLFNSGILDNYFRKSLNHLPLSLCVSCFDNGHQTVRQHCGLNHRPKILEP